MPYSSASGDGSSWRHHPRRPSMRGPHPSRPSLPYGALTKKRNGNVTIPAVAHADAAIEPSMVVCALRHQINP